MKELIKRTQENYKTNKKELVGAVSLHILTAAFGFIASRGIILTTLMPFGLVFVGGCSTVFLPSVAVGAFMGYFIPTDADVSGFRYIAALLAVVSLRLLLANYKRVCENPIFLCVVTAITNLVTGIVSFSGVPIDAVKLSGECVIILGGVFVVRRSFIALSDENAGFEIDSLICLGAEAEFIYKGFIAGGYETEAWHFPMKEAMFSVLPRLIKEGDTVLVKASHSMGFDEVVEELKKLK